MTHKEILNHPRGPLHTNASALRPCGATCGCNACVIAWTIKLGMKA